MIIRDIVNRTALTCVAVLALNGVLSGSAAAGPRPIVNSDGSRSVHVAYKDLDLRSPAAQVELHNRIRKAARLVCRDPGGSFVSQHYECERNAIIGAKPQMYAAINRATGVQLARIDDR